MPTRSPPAESRRAKSARRAGERYTFDEFVTAAENRLPLAAAREIASGAANPASVLYLVGPRGSGKTHLLHATANERNEQLGHSRQQLLRSTDVVVVAGGRFVSELADAIDTRSTDEFQSRYREARLLLIDDVDALAEKSWAQEELVWTLEAIQQAGGHVMLTSRFWPAESALDPRLVSRLSDGVVLALDYPSLESRQELIRRFTRTAGVGWTAAAITAAAQMWHGGVQDLREAVAEVNRSVTGRNGADGGALVDDGAISQLVATATVAPRLSTIVRQTARWFQLTPDQLRGASRQRSVVTARAVAMYLARELTGKSFQEIGAYFSDRDHTTVMHSCRRTAELIVDEAEIRLAVSQLQDELTSRTK